MRSIFFLFLFAIIALFQACAIAQTNSRSDPDQKVLDQLHIAGSDLSKAHKIQFFLYFPSEEKATEASADIQAEGLHVEVQKGTTGTEWLCLAKKEMIPEHSELVRLRNVLESIAKKLNGEYDGWGTDVVK